MVCAVTVVQLSGCACERDRYVYVSGAIDRYDHNRTRSLQSAALRNGQSFKLPARAFTPHGSLVFPEIRIIGVSTSADGLADVRLAPVYSGVPLPLVPEDESDLINYLSSGTSARAGVSIPDLPGDLKATQQTFAPILGVLKDATFLCRAQTSLLEWAKTERLTSTLHVSDARYNLAAFQSVVAVWHTGFWFVLYQLPDQNGPTNCDPYSRLVVVPGPPEGQNYPEKRPS